MSTHGHDQEGDESVNLGNFLEMVLRYQIGNSLMQSENMRRLLRLERMVAGVDVNEDEIEEEVKNVREQLTEIARDVEMQMMQKLYEPAEA
jgi:hypothetical protein